MKETLSSRERVACALRHQSPDRTPLFIKAEKEVWPALCDYLGLEDNEAVMQRLGVDIRTISPHYSGPALEWFEDGSFIDYMGHHRKIAEHPYGTYFEYAGFPLAEAQTVDDVYAHPWPQVDWWDVSHIADEIAALDRHGEYCLLYEAGAVFEPGWGLRGLERFLIDMARQPEIAQAIMTRWADFWIDLGRKVLEAADGRVDIAWTWDDVGTQGGPMISPRMWEKLVKPHHVRLNQALKQYGAKIMYHSCGSIRPFIDGFVDMGVEILNPLQPRAEGMDLKWIKATYGNRLSFHGGMDIQHTLPHGTVEDVAAEVCERIEVLGAGGGYILAPAHAFQADTPPENIVAMYDTARLTPVPA